MTGTYDPDLNLLYWGTANPTPVLQGGPRGGDNLYTCSIVALNPDTGKLVWYFQVPPHDTRLGRRDDSHACGRRISWTRRKLLVPGLRNGYFFVLDRRNGKCLLSVPYMPINWSSGTDEHGHPLARWTKIPRLEARSWNPIWGRDELDGSQLQSRIKAGLCQCSPILCALFHRQVKDSWR